MISKTKTKEETTNDEGDEGGVTKDPEELMGRTECRDAEEKSSRNLTGKRISCSTMWGQVGTQ